MAMIRQESNLPSKDFPLPLARCSYLPIANFRTRSKEFFRGNEIAGKFLSSGTTGQRAVSYFSAAGLKNYRTVAINCFAKVLNSYRRRPIVRGISLIGNDQQSSLATMISWFAQKWPMSFLDKQQLVDQQLVDQHPIFLWATAGQLLQLFDYGTINLPNGSVVIETGGFKNLAVRLNDRDFYQQIADFFAIDYRSVVSEYSMCELACQAYRLKGRDSYRFPSWVQVYVECDGKVCRSGDGLLIIFDRLRNDYPWPLRTDDLVSLASDGSFQVLGRLSDAPLRGCSLN